MKKRWFLVPIALAMLAIGVFTAGVTLAQDSGTDSTSTVSRFASRVAAILGVDQAKVQDAMNQASRELHDEAIKSKLDALVKQGQLTQAQADEYLKWYQARPDDFPRLGGPGFGPGRHHGHGFNGFRGYGEMPKTPAVGTTPTPSVPSTPSAGTNSS